MNKPRCAAVGEYGRCLSDAKYRITIITNKSTWQMDVCEDCRDEEQCIMRGMAESVHRQKVLSETCVPLYGGIAHERARVKALFTENNRFITWKEVSTLIRCAWWDADISRERGVAVLFINRYGKLERVATTSRLRTMTPAQFWQRLRQIDTSRVAEAERKLSK